MWLAQVTATLQGAQLWSFTKPTAKPPPEFLDVAAPADPAGKKADPIINPEHEKWYAKDNQVRSYLFSSLSKDVFSQVASATTAAELWTKIQELQASQSRARIMSTRIALATTTKGSSTVAEYFTKMKGLADEIVSAGKKMDDDEISSYILMGLGEEFDPVVTSVSNRVEPISLQELQVQLVSHEQRREIREGGSHSSVNVATKGGRGGGGNFSNNTSRGGRGGGGRGGFVRGGGGRNGGRNGGERGRNFLHGVFCQICGKEGHMGHRCFKRFDASVTGPPQKSVSSAQTSSYGIDTNWYVDSGATDHITSELDKLSVRGKYQGGDQVHTASGSGMAIDHVGHSVLHTPIRPIHLKNILHVPHTSKNLLSVNRLARDNHAFLEFHPDYFVIKEQATGRMLLKGPCEGGLYPLKSGSKSQSNKEVLGVYKPTASVWHHRLGHASSHVVEQILSRHKLSFVKDSRNNSICDSCQKGKSHQLPYPKSSSVSLRPFELVFSDVWGPAPTSVGRHNYYVSFIDDYSKFTWIYLLKHKSEVFQCFRLSNHG
jgi:histone deacetylase 1/2